MGAVEGCVLGEVGRSVCWRTRGSLVLMATFPEEPPVTPGEPAGAFLEEGASWLVHTGSGI